MQKPFPLDLIEAYFDGEILPEDQVRLEDWLAADRDHVRLFVREAHLHRTLHIAFLAHQAQKELEGFSDTSDRVGNFAEPNSAGRPVGPMRSRFRPRFRWVWTGTAAAVALVAGCFLWFWLSGNGALPCLTVRTLGVSLQRAGSETPVQGKVTLQPDDIIRIEESGEASIEYMGENTQIDLCGATVVQIRQTNRAKRVELVQGTLYAAIAPQRLQRAMVFRTPQAEAKVIGTRRKLSVQPERTNLEVYEGRVQLARLSSDKPIEVKGGYAALAVEGADPVQNPIQEERGTILWEYWKDIKGTAIKDLTSDPRFPSQPSGQNFRARLQSPSSWADAYGGRLRGFLHPPKTGYYTFWVAADDEGEFWLSADERPHRKERLCHASEFTALQEWSKRPEQKSRSVRLLAGRKYYVEAILKEAEGADGLAVAWQGPGISRQIISGAYLSPILSTDSTQINERTPSGRQ